MRLKHHVDDSAPGSADEADEAKMGPIVQNTSCKRALPEQMSLVTAPREHKSVLSCCGAHLQGT